MQNVDAVMLVHLFDAPAHSEFRQKLHVASSVLHGWWCGARSDHPLYHSLHVLLHRARRRQNAQISEVRHLHSTTLRGPMTLGCTGLEFRRPTVRSPGVYGAAW